MAIRTWQSTDGNWANTASWSGAAVPIDGDSVHFPKTNKQSVTSGLGQSLIELVDMIVHPGFEGAIGTPSTLLDIAISGSLLYYGSGGLHVASSLGGVATNIELIMIAAASPGTLITIDSESGDAGTIPLIHLARGNVTFGPNLTGNTNLYIDAVEGVNDVTLTTPAIAGSFVDVWQSAGRVELGDNVSGTWCVSGGMGISELAMTIADLNVTGNARFVHNSTGAITDANVANTAVLDLTDSIAIKTITRLWLKHNSTLKKFDNATLHAIATTHDLRADS